MGQRNCVRWSRISRNFSYHHCRSPEPFFIPPRRDTKQQCAMHAYFFREHIVRHFSACGHSKQPGRKHPQRPSILTSQRSHIPVLPYSQPCTQPRARGAPRLKVSLTNRAATQFRGTPRRATPQAITRVNRRHHYAVPCQSHTKRANMHFIRPAWLTHSGTSLPSHRRFARWPQYMELCN